MESSHNSFPVFVSGQYLTSEHLNEMQGFLWQEEKNCRSFLAGNGIIAGMVTGFEDDTTLTKIKLSAGAASTVDGYLVITDPVFIAEQINTASTIDEFAVMTTEVAFDKARETTLTAVVTTEGARQLMEKSSFDKLENKSFAASTKDLHAFEIYTETSKLEDLPEGSRTVGDLNINSTQALANYLLLAWVFIDEAANDHCQQGDCNSKGIQRNYLVRYFLLENNQFDVLNSLSPALNTCSVARIKNLSASGSSLGLQAKSFEAWSASATELLPYFSNADTTKKLSTVALLLSADEQAALATASARFNNIIASVNNTICPQYYNLFAADLAQAINELVLFYNEYAEKYPTISRDRIERVVMLGKLRSTGVDDWRYYFIPMTAQPVHISDKRKLTRLFLRVMTLVNNFIFPAEKLGKIASQVKSPLVIPTLIGDALLQNRAVPYYYDVVNNADVFKYWNPSGGNLKNIFCYYDSVATERKDVDKKLGSADWYNDNFFRIEGHIGLSIASAKSIITNLIINDSIPIQLLDCDIKYTGPKKWHNWYAEFSGFLAESVDKLRKESKTYAFQPLKKISTYALETSYRKPDEVKTILNDLTAYSGVFYNAKQGVAAPKKGKKGLKAGAGAPAAAAVTSAITPEVIETYKSIVPQSKVTDLIKKYNDAIVEVKDPNAKKLIILKDLAGLEYMGGAPRGGSFILIHEDGKVIGDACLPYYYRIDQGRVFDQ